MIAKFLVLGTLHELKLGMSKSEVLTYTGQPKESSPPDSRILIWKIEGLELGFLSDTLSFIGIYFINGTSRLPSRLLTAELISVPGSFEGFKRHVLKPNRIDFALEPALTFDQQTCLLIPKSGARIYFVEGELTSIQLASGALRL